MPTKKKIYKFNLYLVCIVFLSLFILELSLRFIADRQDKPKLESWLHPPYFVDTVDVKGLYTNGGLVYLRTDKFGLIEPSPSRSRKNILFCGGSTTESYCVSEKSRWVNLLNEIYNKEGISFYNAGMSGKNTKGCIKTIEYLKSKSLSFDSIFVITSVNDFGSYMRELRKKVRNKNKMKKTRNSKVKEKPKIQKVSKLRTWIRKLHSHKIYIKIKKFLFPRKFPKDLEVVTINKKPTIAVEKYRSEDQGGSIDWSPESIKQFKAEENEAFYNLRNWADANNVHIIVASEAHSFRASTESFVEDFRKFQEMKDRNGTPLSYEETAKILDEATDIYLESAKNNGFDILDLAKEMNVITNSKDGGSYMYDGVHYTEKGSKKLSKVLSSYIEKNRAKLLN